jgi:hypothetical protein
MCSASAVCHTREKRLRSKFGTKDVSFQIVTGWCKHGRRAQQILILQLQIKESSFNFRLTPGAIEFKSIVCPGNAPPKVMASANLIVQNFGKKITMLKSLRFSM